MTVLVTGSSGHLGEALVRRLRQDGRAVRSMDLLPSPYTDIVGSISSPGTVAEAMRDCHFVLHAATLHKPHVATHTRQQFVDVNITGTLTLLEAAVTAGVRAFIFTSTTSVFGHAMTSRPGAPAVWVDETLSPQPKNIYGVTKLAAENLCALFHEKYGLPTIVLRTSRFFPEDDDAKSVRDAFSNDNAKATEFLNRRIDLEDAATAHFQAIDYAATVGFGRYIISASTPFEPHDVAQVGADLGAALDTRVPAWRSVYGARDWRLPDRLDRIYDNAKARRDLNWRPVHDFSSVIDRLSRGELPASALAIAVGSKGYHTRPFAGDGPYPVE